MITGHKGYCSWCFSEITPVLVEKKRIGKNVYSCPKCKKELIECLGFKCKNYAKYDNYIIEQDGEKVEKTAHDHFCAEHQHMIPNFTTANSNLEEPSDYLKIYQKDKTNYSRLSKVGLITLGTTLVIAPVSFFAAPAVGGAIGALMGYSGAVATNVGLAFLGGGSLVAGGFGMVGGTAVITVLGSSVGGALGAYVGNSYLGDIDGFSIKKIRDGKNPAIITINGFLSGKKEEVSHWENSIDKIYPNNAWYHVNWEAKKLADIGKFIIKKAGTEAVKEALLEVAKKATAQAGKQLAPAYTVAQVIALATNPWHTAMVKAEQTGVLLADILKRCNQQDFILIGHSLGARVIYNCLSTLATTKNKNIHSVHLLGGAIDNDSTYWTCAQEAVKYKIYNYHTKDDLILKYLYSVGTFFSSSPIGRNTIHASKVKNINVSGYVNGHMDFKQNFYEYHPFG